MFLHEMRSKSQSSGNLKFVLVLFFVLSILFLIFRSNFSSSQSNSWPESSTHLPVSTKNQTESSESAVKTPCPTVDPTCSKTPVSLANAIIHYATSNITPQQTINEISVSARVLARKAPCNFLVFGLGHDSLMWTSLNHGGRTVFLEENEDWINQIRSRFPTLESYQVLYDTKVPQADQLLRIGQEKNCKTVEDPRFSKCPLSHKGFPKEVYDVEWDLIMVDAPTGYFDGAPGRMTAIYTAGLMARNRESGETDIFVHDVDRVVENKFSTAFLCEGYMREQEGRIRHFTVPSHRPRLSQSFCP